MRLHRSIVVLLAIFTLTIVHIDCRRNKSKDVKGKTDSKTPDMDTIICPTCDRLFCTVRKASRLKCKGGTTTDICGCCPVCAKRVGEACGGEWNYLGKCDTGLYCKAPTISLLPPILLHLVVKAEEVPRGGIAEGTCVQLQDMIPNDENPHSKTPNILHPKCQPKCTPDFCLKNARAICSAVDVVDMKRECHGSCQHTSCQACSWVDPEPDCGACHPDDITCIKRFAKCIKRSTCTRAKFPCKSIADEDHVGKFQCMVPKCLDKS